jgi:hypothetical protein
LQGFTSSGMETHRREIEIEMGKTIAVQITVDS